MRKNKKRLSVIFIALALVFATAVSFAYFTDYEQASTSGTAGTLDLTLTATWTAETDLIPGDIYTLNYTLANTGNKSADVRETIAITSNVELTGTPAQFEIYAAGDVEADANGAYAPKAGAQPLSVRTTGSYTADGKTYYTVTYKIPEFILNGDSSDPYAEVESGALNNSNTKTGTYVVLFSKAADNKFMGANITVEYLAEAKQHRNTDDSVWSLISHDEITIGGVSYNAVEKKQ